MTLCEIPENLSFCPKILKSVSKKSLKSVSKKSPMLKRLSIALSSCRLFGRFEEVYIAPGP